jgi:hypothetical protein
VVVVDQRQTFGDIEELKSLLTDFEKRHLKVAFLIDREGLTRTEGVILAVEQGTPVTETIVKLDIAEHGDIYLNDIIAVNGIFRSDYTEC